MEKENKKINDKDLANVTGGGVVICSEYNNESACNSHGSCAWNSKDNECQYLPGDL